MVIYILFAYSVSSKSNCILFSKKKDDNNVVDFMKRNQKQPQTTA